MTIYSGCQMLYVEEVYMEYILEENPQVNLQPSQSSRRIWQGGIDAYRRRVAFDLLMSAKKDDYVLYTAIRAIYPNATIGKWKKDDNYVVDRDTMLTLCVLQRYTVEQANDFLVKQMCSYPIHARNPEEAAYYFVLSNQKALLGPLNYEAVVADVLFMEKLKNHEPERTTYKKKRNIYFASDNERIFPITKDNILLYTYSFRNCEAQLLEQALAAVMLTMYADNFAFFAKTYCEQLKKNELSFETYKHTSFFVGQINTRKTEDEFIHLIKENAFFWGVARMKNFSKIKEMFLEQATSNAKDCIVKLEAALYSWGFEWDCEAKNDASMESLSEKPADKRELISTLVREYANNEALCYTDMLFGFTIARCYTRIVSEIQRKTGEAPLSDSLFYTLNTVVRLLLGSEWKNIQTKKTVNTATYHLSFLEMAASLLQECGLDHSNKECDLDYFNLLKLSIEGKHNSLGSMTYLVPEAPISRTLALMIWLQSELEKLNSVRLSLDERKALEQGCNLHLDALGFPLLNDALYPDQVVLSVLRAESDKAVPVRNIISRIAQNFSCFFDEVYQYHNNRIRQERASI